MIRRSGSAAARVPRWVAAAADDPAVVRALWRSDPLCCVELATGRTFDAVTVDLRTGMEALDLLRCRAGAVRAGRGQPPGPAASLPRTGPSGRSGAPTRTGVPRARRLTRWAPAGPVPVPSLDAARTRPGHSAPPPARPPGRCADGPVSGRGRTARPVLFPALVDGARGRMHLLVPRGAAPWLGGLAPARDVEYHGDGAPIALPGPGATAGEGTELAWAVPPGAPVERLRGMLTPLATALATARLTVGWCTGERAGAGSYANAG